MQVYMVLLRKARPDEQDPTYQQERSQGTRNSSKQDLAENHLKEGDIVILKDDPEAKDWYCAEIRVLTLKSSPKFTTSSSHHAARALPLPM